MVCAIKSFARSNPLTAKKSRAFSATDDRSQNAQESSATSFVFPSCSIVARRTMVSNVFVNDEVSVEIRIEYTSRKQQE